MDEVFEAVCPALCACWLVPFALIGGLLLIVESFVTGWRWRGLDKQGLFCRRCRFDLRGASGRRCTECGAGLDLWGVLAPGVDPPLNLASRVLLVTMGCVGPLILAGVLLAMVVPFNYTTDRTLTLTGVESLPPQMKITLNGYGERALWGKGRPSAVHLSLDSWEPLFKGPPGQLQYDMVDNRMYAVPLPDDDAAVVSDARWSRVCEQYQLPDDSAELAERRAELVEAIRYMAGSKAGPPKLQWYRYSETQSTRFDPLGWFFLVELVLGLVVWGLLVRWVYVAHGRALRGYALRQQRAVEKLDDWIARNRAGAGLDGERSKQ